MTVERGDATFIEVNNGGGWVKPANQLDASMPRSKDLFDKTTKDSAGWKEQGSGFKGWEMTMSALFNEADSGYVIIVGAWEANTNIQARFFDGTQYHTGNAEVGNPEITGPKDEAKQYSVTFSGDGPITRT